MKTAANIKSDFKIQIDNNKILQIVGSNPGIQFSDLLTKYLDSINHPRYALGGHHVYVEGFYFNFHVACAALAKNDWLVMITIQFRGYRTYLYPKSTKVIINDKEIL